MKMMLMVVPASIEAVVYKKCKCMMMTMEAHTTTTTTTSSEYDCANNPQAEEETIAPSTTRPVETRIEKSAQLLISLLKDAPTVLPSPPPGDNEHGIDLYSVAVHDAFFFPIRESTDRLHRIVREVLWANHDVASQIMHRAMVLRREDPELLLYDDDRSARMSSQLLWLYGLFCDKTAFE
jgi:hypothetical protein